VIGSPIFMRGKKDQLLRGK